MTKKTIDTETIDYIAGLAHIHTSKETSEILTKNLTKILDYMSMLNKLDTKNIEPTSHTLVGDNLLRDDVPKDFDNKAGIVRNFPELERNLLKIPKVM